MATTTKDNGKDWDSKEIGCLWKRVSAKGEDYLTGIINLKVEGFDKDVQIIGFSNKRKMKDTHPDVRLYISDKDKKQSSTTPAAKPAAKAVKQAATPEPPPAPEADTNELI